MRCPMCRSETLTFQQVSDIKGRMVCEKCGHKTADFDFVVTFCPKCLTLTHHAVTGKNAVTVTCCKCGYSRIAEE